MKLALQLSSQGVGQIISKQLVRSGTAIGALIREAEFAESRKDFIHKLSLSLKEVNETVYWIEILHTTALISNEMFTELHRDASELIKMLIASVKTSKSTTPHS